MTPRIESLLSARLFLAPQLHKDRIYFISNLSGRLSLYSMPSGGGVPEPLLPPDLALQNPEILESLPFYVYPEIGKIMVTIDHDGDEVYRPMMIPIGGGFPEEIFPQITDARIFSMPAHDDRTTLYMLSPSLSRPVNTTYVGDVATGAAREIFKSEWGGFPIAGNNDDTMLLMGEGYTVGDGILRLVDLESGANKIIYGKPIEEREPEEEVPLSGFGAAVFSESDRGIITVTSLFADTYSLGYVQLDRPDEIAPVNVTGTVHTGAGELEAIEHTKGDRYTLRYNIDGASWLYEGTFDEANRRFSIECVLCGQGELANGVLESVYYDEDSDRFVLSFSTSISPTQIYLIAGEKRDQVVRLTNERVLGIEQLQLSPGEDASFTSHDGTRISARLYLPAAELGFEGPRPLVYYVHGGPQGQERPNFAWFSMPLIQFLTLNGFAVFVPNVRGSTGYGLSYTKQVDHDWGGQDRLDHVYAMTEVLPKDQRIDVARAGVVGRSYGGYMTLTLALRHPELWKAAVDMFGPYDLVTWLRDRIPETWKAYFYVALGHPDRDRDFLVERSPKTYMEQLQAPMLVIQGAHDPRVIEAESRAVVQNMKEAGKDVDIIVFENEGHDVIKYENKVRCYNAITDFFKEKLKP